MEPYWEALRAMRKLLTFILLVGVFYGGYELGRQPGAPDLRPVVKKCYVCAHDVSWRVAQWASAKWEEMRANSTDPAVADGYGGASSQEE